MADNVLLKKPASFSKSFFLLRVTQMLFFVIIVLGESFKLKISTIAVSLSMLLTIPAFVLWFLTWNMKVKRSSSNFLQLGFAGLLLFFSLVGLLRGNALPDILEDAYPLVIFLVFSVILSGLNSNQLENLWKSICFFGILAAIKVFILLVLPVNAEWDNNWQATKIGIPGTNVYRIILRGGDFFLLLTCLILLIKLLSHQNKVINYILFFIVTAAVFISFSRSSFLAIIISASLVILLFNRFFSRQKILVLVSVCGLLILMLLPYLNIISAVSGLFEARVEAFDNNGFAMDFRSEEKRLIKEKAASVLYTGNGLGSFFYLDYSGSDKSDGKSLYAHDFNYWMILKIGFLGLLCFYLIVFKAGLNNYRFIKQGIIESKRSTYFAVSLFGSLIILLIVSLFANKINTMPGSIFLAFFVTAIQKMRVSNKYYYEPGIVLAAS